jgi:hypothetical protein
LFICNWIKKRREPRGNNVTLKLRRVRKADKPLKKEPSIRHLDRTPGRKDKVDDKSSGMEILMTEAFAKIKPTDPLILPRHAARRKRKWPDSSGDVVS